MTAIQRPGIAGVHRTRVKKRNSYTVVYESSSTVCKCGHIEYFFVHAGEEYAAVHELSVLANPESVWVATRGLLPVKKESHLSLVPLQCLKNKCIFIDIESHLYVGIFLNSLTHD